MYIIAQQEKMNNFETKSEDIDNEQLKLPESAEYDAIIRMPTTEFAKIFQRLCIIDDNDAGNFYLYWMGFLLFPPNILVLIN